MAHPLPLRPNVCMLVFNQAGLVLMGEREGNPGHWQFPQGGIEEGMSPEDTVTRELKEELGLRHQCLGRIIKLDATHEYEWDDPPSYAKGVWRGQTQTFWAVEFVGTDQDVDLAADDDPEFMAWQWCSIERVRELAPPRRLAGYERALQAFVDAAPWKRDPAS